MARQLRIVAIMSLSSKMFTLLILLPITFSPIILNLNNSLLFAKNWLSSESRDNVTLDGNRREAKVAKTLCGLLLFFKWKIPVESKFVTLSICPAELELGFNHAEPSRRAGAPKIRQLVEPGRVVGDGGVLICHVSKRKMRECKK